MKKLRWITITLLVCGAVALGWKLQADWRVYRAKNDPAALKLRPMSPPAALPGELPAHDYAVVAQQNPFHPERNDAVPPPPQAAAVASGPPPLFYGSMILGKERFALMAMENHPKPRKVLEGDSFNGYKWAEVLPQSVVLESGGSKNEVMLYNAISRLHRDAARTAPSPAAHATTTSTGSATAATTVAATDGANAS